MGIHYPNGYFFNMDSIKIKPGSYYLAVEFFDDFGKNIVRFLDSLYVPATSLDSLNLSDIVLANQIRLQTSIVDVKRNKISISPNFTYSFLSGQDLFLYYEIYNLEKNENQKTNYRVSHIVRSLEKSRSIVSSFLTRVGIKKQIFSEVVTTFTYKGDQRNENHYRIVQLTDYPPGHYTMTVQVEDLVKNQTNERTIPFQIQ
jgi:hypothetical protein